LYGALLGEASFLLASQVHEQVSKDCRQLEVGAGREVDAGRHEQLQSEFSFERAAETRERHRSAYANVARRGWMAETLSGSM